MLLKISVIKCKHTHGKHAVSTVDEASLSCQIDLLITTVSASLLCYSRASDHTLVSYPFLTFPAPSAESEDLLGAGLGYCTTALLLLFL